MYKSKFYWNEETLDYFNYKMTFETARETYEQIQEFVECECSLEDNETEEMLVDDLYNTVYNL